MLSGIASVGLVVRLELVPAVPAEVVPEDWVPVLVLVQPAAMTARQTRQIIVMTALVFIPDDEGSPYLLVTIVYNFQHREKREVSRW
jgi:hypothetical protein